MAHPRSPEGASLLAVRVEERNRLDLGEVSHSVAEVRPLELVGLAVYALLGVTR